MEYNFKLTLEEYATALKFISEFDEKNTHVLKLIKKVIVGAWLIMSIVYFVIYGFKAFLVFVVLAGLIVLLLFWGLSPEQLHKKRLRLVKNKVNKNPDILGWQNLKIEENSIIYSFEDNIKKTNLSNVSKFFEEDGIIVIINNKGNISALIPCSCFQTPLDKEKFINTLNISNH